MDAIIVPPEENAIQLLPMRQTAEAKVQSEDWTGLTGAKERRKLQNRLNQRARSEFLSVSIQIETLKGNQGGD